MQLAIFSDVHSNLPALEAVLADIEQRGVTQRVCLGDIVGYNAEPAECVERVRPICEVILQGNHDAAAAGGVDLSWFNPVARAGLEYARDRLTEEQRRWLCELPLVKARAGWTYVHASLWDPAEWEYVTSAPTAVMHFHQQATALGFCGHTHRPLIWNQDNSGLSVITPRDKSISLNGPGKHLVNVGSVGQSRDGDSRACYVLFDPEALTVEFHRVAYDVAREQKAIRAAGLPDMLALRLEMGR